MTPDDLNGAFAHNLHAELTRRRRQITARAVAKEVGIEESDLSKIRHGKQTPSVTLAAKIARALGTSLDALAMRPAAPAAGTGWLDEVFPERRVARRRASDVLPAEQERSAGQ